MKTFASSLSLLLAACSQVTYGSDHGHLHARADKACTVQADVCQKALPILFLPIFAIARPHQIKSLCSGVSLTEMKSSDETLLRR